MKLNHYNLVIVFVLIQMALLPFLNLQQLSNLALCTAIGMICVGVWKLTQEIKAYYFAILGYGVMNFLDIWKYNFLFNNSYRLYKNYDTTIYWTYISFIIFLFIYKFKSFKIRIPSIEISNFKVSYLAIPISVAFLVFYRLYFKEADITSTFGSVMVLVGFFPKACAVLVFYLFMRYKKWQYLFWFFVLLVLSFTEATRRVYITMFLVCFTMIYSYIIEKKGRIYGKYKVMTIILFVGIFFYMNFLRADTDIGKGYQEGQELQNTINYMMQLKALDTYDNTAFILSKIPSKFDYYYGETYAAFFVQFMPRIAWEKKPVGLGGPLGLMRTAGTAKFTKSKWLKRGKGISLSPGLVGEAYANFGKIGIILISILFGLATKLFDNNVDTKLILRNPIHMANATWYASFFLLLRGDMIAALFYSTLFYLFLRLWLIVVKK